MHLRWLSGCEETSTKDIFLGNEGVDNVENRDDDDDVPEHIRRGLSETGWISRGKGVWTQMFESAAADARQASAFPAVEEDAPAAG